MSDLSWIYTYGFLGIRLFDLPSLFICLFFVSICCYKFSVPTKYQIILIFHCFLPFLINDVLFSTHYMPDQFKYWLQTNEIRAGNLGLIDALTSGQNVKQASVFFSFMPFP